MSENALPDGDFGGSSTRRVGLSRTLLGSVGVKIGVRDRWIIPANKPSVRSSKPLEKGGPGSVVVPALTLRVLAMSLAQSGSTFESSQSSMKFRAGSRSSRCEVQNSVAMLEVCWD